MSVHDCSVFTAYVGITTINVINRRHVAGMTSLRTLISVNMEQQHMITKNGLKRSKCSLEN